MFFLLCKTLSKNSMPPPETQRHQAFAPIPSHKVSVASPQSQRVFSHKVSAPDRPRPHKVSVASPQSQRSAPDNRLIRLNCRARLFPTKSACAVAHDAMPTRVGRVGATRAASPHKVSVTPGWRKRTGYDPIRGTPWRLGSSNRPSGRCSSRRPASVSVAGSFGNTSSILASSLRKRSWK